jgi:hypothetical protein
VAVKAVLILFLAVATPAFAQDDKSEPQADGEAQAAQFPETAPPHQVLIHPHREQRDKYIWGTFGPPGLLDAAIGASLGQWLNTPEVWGQTGDAYAKRFATEYAESAINATTKYALVRLRDEDPSFRPCSCAGVQRRAMHAIISPFVAYRFEDGQPQFSAARMAGTAVAGVVSGNTWKPGRPSVGSQAAHVGVDMLSAMGVNLLREFVFHHRRPPQ